MMLVTGGSWFIGREVCRQLCARGYDVIATDRSVPACLPCPSAAGDIGAPGFLAELFEAHRSDAVIHPAALRKTESGERPEEGMRVSIGAT